MRARTQASSVRWKSRTCTPNVRATSIRRSSSSLQWGVPQGVSTNLSLLFLAEAHVNDAQRVAAFTIGCRKGRSSTSQNENP